MPALWKHRQAAWFEVSLVYRGSSRTGRATQRNGLEKTNKCIFYYVCVPVCAWECTHVGTGVCRELELPDWGVGK